MLRCVTGLFIPIAAFGAGFGRLLGDLLAYWLPDGVVPFSNNTPIISGAYAMVGAAAMAGGVTHSLSAAVAVAELTGSVSMLAGMLVATVLSVVVCRALSLSIYDSIVLERGLPLMPVPEQTSLSLVAADIMERDITSVPRYVTADDLISALATVPPQDDELVPVVDSDDEKLLLGGVSRAELMTMLQEHAERGGELAKVFFILLFAALSCVLFLFLLLFFSLIECARIGCRCSCYS